jgi:murein DD-endopeptidase MepM/ murein hydrolase activator NlpD
MQFWACPRKYLTRADFFRISFKSPKLSRRRSARPAADYNRTMRRVTPLIIVIAALGLYAARDTVLAPFTPVTRLAERLTREALEHPPGASQIQTASVDGGSFGLAEASLAESPNPSHRPTDPVQGAIRRNSSLYVELRRIGVSPQDIDGVVRASRKEFNLKRVRAGQKFDVYTSASGSVDSLFFYFARDEFLGVRREGTHYVASIDTVPYTVTYHVTEATIAQSVFVSLQEQDADTDLASQMAEIFGWTIDFFTDIRRGDSFAVLYEHKSYDDGRAKIGDVLAARVVSNGKEYYAFRHDAGSGRIGYYDEVGRSMEKSLSRAPVRYNRVTSNFSQRRYHPINKRYQPHYGVDFGAPYGTPVQATGDGTVVAATRRTANGRYVKIKHNNTYTTYYLHLQRFAKGIRQGKKVRQGQVIGYVGSTGWANGPHVCYRIKRNGSWVNPRRINLPSKKPVPAASMVAFERARDSYLLRLQESTLDGVDNHTTLVERPARRADAQMRTLF